MERERVHTIIESIESLASPSSLTAIEQSLIKRRAALQQDIEVELRRSLNFGHIKLHPDLKNHDFAFTDAVKDVVAARIAEVLITDGCNWDHHPTIKIEPAVFLNNRESLQDSAVVVVHFQDGQREHRSHSFRYL